MKVTAYLGALIVVCAIAFGIGYAWGLEVDTAPAHGNSHTVGDTGPTGGHQHDPDTGKEPS